MATKKKAVKAVKAVEKPATRDIEMVAEAGAMEMVAGMETFDAAAA